MELGIYTFVENTPLAGGKQKRSDLQRVKDLLEEAELAEQVGLDLFGVGEHHRPEYIFSSPSTILSAIAARTRSIRLSSAVSVLGSDDPVRLHQQFATLDLVSEGRAEIMVGRGSFIESFPLFGYDLQKYDELFSEKLELLLQLRESEIISWSGRHRPALDRRGIYPRPVQERLPVWVAVGGTPASAERAGLLGLPMALGIIGGEPARFEPFARLHRKAALEAGHPPPALSINSHGYLADDTSDAVEDAFEAFSVTMNRIGKERGWPPMTKTQFEASTRLEGANLVGSPEQVIDKILYQYEIFGHSRFLMQMSVGSLPQKKILRSIELFGDRVAPAVRKAIRKDSTDSDSTG